MSYFINRQTKQMLSPDYRVSYISSIGQHASVVTLTLHLLHYQAIALPIHLLSSSLQWTNGINILKP